MSETNAAKRQRLIECARKDPEMSSTMLAERFSVSRSRVTEWLREAGVVVARHEMMGAYSDSSRRMKGFRQRQKARRAAQ